MIYFNIQRIKVSPSFYGNDTTYSGSLIDADGCPIIDWVSIDVLNMGTLMADEEDNTDSDAEETEDDDDEFYPTMDELLGMYWDELLELQPDDFEKPEEIDDGCVVPLQDFMMDMRIGRCFCHVDQDAASAALEGTDWNDIRSVLRLQDGPLGKFIYGLEAERVEEEYRHRMPIGKVIMLSSHAWFEDIMPDPYTETYLEDLDALPQFVPALTKVSIDGIERTIRVLIDKDFAANLDAFCTDSIEDFEIEDQIGEALRTTYKTVGEFANVDTVCVKLPPPDNL